MDTTNERRRWYGGDEEKEEEEERRKICITAASLTLRVIEQCDVLLLGTYQPGTIEHKHDDKKKYNVPCTIGKADVPSIWNESHQPRLNRLSFAFMGPSNHD